MRFAKSRTVGSKNNSFICSVNGTDIIEAGGLIRYFCNDWRFTFSDAGDLIELPVKISLFALMSRGSDNHAEHRLFPVPTDRGIAHGYGISGLKPAHPIPGSL